MTLVLSTLNYSEADSEDLVLTITAGRHQGANQPLHSRDFLMVGSGADCEIILTDNGVMPHHCVISRTGSELMLRPLDAEVGLGDDVKSPGQLYAFKPGETLTIGESSFTIKKHVLSKAAKKSGRQRTRYWAKGFWLTMSTLTLMALVLVLLATAQRPEVEENVSTFGFNHSGVNEQNDLGTNQLYFEQWYLEHQNQQSEPLFIAPPIDIAASVQEILRLSGINSRAQLLAPGKVEVTGHFGDSRALASVIQSRAIREIEGLDQVVAINLDAPSAPIVGPQKVAKKRISRVTQIVSGSDPYLVSQDGSRYYLGAELPDGSVLVQIEGRHMFVEHQEKVFRVLAAGRKLDGQYRIEKNQIQLNQPLITQR